MSHLYETSSMCKNRADVGKTERRGEDTLKIRVAVIERIVEPSHMYEHSFSSSLSEQQ
jgi:hypothetical protein